MMTPSRMEFLSRVPLILNSSLETRKVIELALLHLQRELDAEAGSVFMRDKEGGRIAFWALRGEKERELQGAYIPEGKGIVGWVISRNEPALVNAPENDPRFFGRVDEETGFSTRNLVCVPLAVRGGAVIGALQVVNCKKNEGFTPEDLEFLERFGGQLTLAVENARLFEGMQAANQTLKHLDQKKGEILSLLSHELRTPLNVIQTTVDLLTAGRLPDEARIKMTATLLSGVERMKKLVTKVRNLSAASEPDFEIQLEPVVIEEVISELHLHFSAVVEKRKLTLAYEWDGAKSLVKADRNLLIVVLTNLLSNAVRFTPDGGKITLRVFEKTGLMWFEVEDNGIGIASNQLNSIFEKFYEVQSVMEHSSGEFEFKSGGLGLGLATAKRLLELHGTSMQVKSVVGKGSQFSFSLPIMPSKQADGAIH